MGQRKSSRRGQASVRLGASLVLAVALAGALGGCDYLNLRNGLLDPSQVGRFDKSNPWGNGEARPVKWPIIETLDVVDEAVNHWPNATDPTPADLEPDTKEYTLAVGDVVRVNIYELIVPGQTYSTDATINELNSINVMNLGNIKVTGLTPSQLEQKITQLVIDKGILPPAGEGRPGPQITVNLLGSRQRVFSMLGSVARPGTYNILATDFRILDAMALAGDVPVQPGMDYLYIIRPTSYGEKKDEHAGLPLPANATTKSMNPSGVIEDLEKSTAPSKIPAPMTMPSTTPETTPALPPAPASSPQGEGPHHLTPMPEAMVISTPPGGVLLAQADTKDLEAALTPATATTVAATTAAATATMGAAAATTQATTAPSDTLLENAMSQPATNSSPQYVFVDGKLVLLPGATTTSATGVAMVPATTTTPLPRGTTTAPGLDLTPTEDRIPTQRVIRIPIQQVREGNSRYNIVIRPGDVINVPGAEPGEFYLMGHVNGGGVYSLTGRKVTLKQAVAAARGLDGLAIPRRCELIRRVGSNQEVTVQVNLQSIFDGEQPDMFLKPNDVVNVGTDAIAPFLAVTRNAYRASYGWGYVYDKNIGQSGNYTGN